MFSCLNLNAAYPRGCSNDSTILIAEAVPLREHKAIAFKGVWCCSLEILQYCTPNCYDTRLYDAIIAIVFNLAANASRFPCLQAFVVSESKI